MADKNWDDVPYVDGDCVRDEPEWNDMVEYIKHSASVDFIIYDDEASTNQTFKFSIDGTNDVIEGRTTGNDLKIVGVEGIHNYFKAGEEFKLFDGATEVLRVSYAANVTTIECGTVVGDDLVLKGSSANPFPYIKVPGNGDIQLHTIGHVYIYKGATPFMDLTEIGTDDKIGGLTANNDLFLAPNGTGVVKFGTYAAIVAETLQGYVTIKDEAGNSRKVAVVA